MFKRNKNIEYNDPLTSESKHALAARLAEVDDTLELIAEKIEMSYLTKANGLKHDGEHNIFVDAATQNQLALQQEREALLQRLDRINAGLARVALETDFTTR